MVHRYCVPKERAPSHGIRTDRIPVAHVDRPVDGELWGASCGNAALKLFLYSVHLVHVRRLHSRACSLMLHNFGAKSISTCQSSFINEGYGGPTKGFVHTIDCHRYSCHGLPANLDGNRSATERNPLFAKTSSNRLRISCKEELFLCFPP